MDNVDSYHLGVVTTDAYAGNMEGCQDIGDFVTRTAGHDASGQDCGPFAEGHRFATEQDDLAETFTCMARVGIDGAPLEYPVTATIAALSPERNAPGACNEGFVRDDPILVVVVVTDDPPFPMDPDDAHEGLNTSGWHDAVLAAKGGDPGAVVVVGFVPWNNVEYLDPYAWESPNLIRFVQSFGDRGLLASVCDDAYDMVFGQAVETIGATCELFMPPG